MLTTITAALATAAVTVAAPTPSSIPTTTPTHHAPAPRGSIVSATRVQHLTAGQVRSALTKDGFDISKVRDGVSAYRLVYRTVDVTGLPTTASGLVVLPDDGQRRLRVVSYTHGTMSGRDEAPSVDSGGRSDEGLTFASAGNAAVLPDYIGLGVGPGHHPYLQLPSEVSAELDMLRAADRFAQTVHRRLDHRVLVTGFSQGGSAALAFGKSLEHGADRRFSAAAVSGISGPYDLTGQELPAAFDGRLDPREVAYYFAYVTIAYNRTYHLYDRPSQVFRAPYDTTMPRLYDGSHDENEIFPALPATPQQLFTPAWLHQLQHPSGRLLRALRANQTACDGWSATAGVRVRLYAAHGDKDVAIGNSYSCQRQLADDGVTSAVIDTGNVLHLDSGRRGLADTLAWFIRLAPPQAQSGGRPSGRVPVWSTRK